LQFALDRAAFTTVGVCGGTSGKQRRSSRGRGLDAVALIAELDA
jgi:hypothetical protein